MHPARRIDRQTMHIISHYQFWRFVYHSWIDRRPQSKTNLSTFHRSFLFFLVRLCCCCCCRLILADDETRFWFRPDHQCTWPVRSALKLWEGFHRAFYDISHRLSGIIYIVLSCPFFVTTSQDPICGHCVSFIELRYICPRLTGAGARFENLKLLFSN